ncbi:hypothetical protein [Sporanaerobacter acetigenes]|uniref:hypothetical protein n=1 Tax=Sporanaerobacter acetigenes TaxID=165813 RepID=UPI00104B52C0|nr:hypothetical protein [Sporanaerobacter acetigenes]
MENEEGTASTDSVIYNDIRNYVKPWTTCVLIFIVALKLAGCSISTSNLNVDDIGEYLKNNHFGMNLEEDYIKGLSIFDKDLKK